MFVLDKLHFQPGEIYFTNDNTISAVAGMRYEINYLAVVKLNTNTGNQKPKGKAIL